MNQTIITPETAVLYLLATGDNLPYKFSVLKESYFPSDVYKRIFLKLKSTWNSAGDIDPLSASNALGKDYDIIDYASEDRRPTEKNFNVYLKQLKEHSLTTHFLRKIDAIKNAGIAPREVYSQLKSLLREYEDSNTGFHNFLDLSVEAVETIRNFDPKKLVYSGFPTLDKTLCGFRPKCIYIYAARTNIGKTNFAVNLSLQIANQGMRVLVFSSEMFGVDVMQKRIFPIYSGLPAYDFSQEESFKPRLDEFAQNYASKIAELNIAICDKGRPSIEDLEYGIEKFNPQIVILDHLHRCELPKAENYRLMLREFMVRLTDVAKKNNLPIVVASQISREMDKSSSEPTLADLSESKAIEEEATAVLLLWVDAKKNLNSQHRIISAKIAKNRNGPPCRFDLKVDNQNLRMEEINGN